MRKSLATMLLGAAVLAGCAGVAPGKSQPPPATLAFGPELRPGRPEASPAWPFEFPSHVLEAVDLSGL